MALADLFPTASGADDRGDWAWVTLLAAAALLSSVTFACVTPFAAFALLTAATLRLPRALAVMAALWLVNQALGFCALGYPLDAPTLAWGGAIGIAALAGTAAAGMLLRLRNFGLARLAGAFAAAFIVYEAVLFLTALVLGGAENFSLGIVARLALSDAGWLIGVAILRHGLLRLVAAGGRRPVTT
jgi:hypothetical protein